MPVCAPFFLHPFFLSTPFCYALYAPSFFITLSLSHSLLPPPHLTLSLSPLCLSTSLSLPPSLSFSVCLSQSFPFSPNPSVSSLFTLSSSLPPAPFLYFFLSLPVFLFSLPFLVPLFTLLSLSLFLSLTCSGMADADCGASCLFPGGGMCGLMADGCCMGCCLAAVSGRPRLPAPACR